MSTNGGRTSCAARITCRRAHGRFRPPSAVRWYPSGGCERCRTVFVRTQLEDEEISRIAGTYYAWRGHGHDAYADVPGFFRSVGLDETKKQNFVLTPGRYVGASAEEGTDDNETTDEKIARLKADLKAQFQESDRLQALVLKQLDLVDVEPSE